MLSFFRQAKYMLFILFSLIIFTTGCDNSGSTNKDEAKAGISYFAFYHDLNPVLGEQNAIGKIESGNIYVAVPHGTDVTSLIPTFNFGGDSVIVGSAPQISGETAQNFTFPVSYVLNVSTEEKLYYTVFVNVAKENTKRITSFAFMENDNPEFDNDDLPDTDNFVFTIPEDENVTDLSITMPRNVDLTSLEPQISYLGKKMWPSTNVVQNFSTPVGYTIAAEDGSEIVYTITVNLEKSDTKEITKFQFLRSEKNKGVVVDVDGKINNETKEITVEMPAYAELESLVPHIEIIGKSISPSISEAQNFSGPVNYTVTAKDGSTEVYTVNVINAKNPSNELKKFKFLAAENVGIVDDIIVDVKRPIVNIVIPYNYTAEVTSLVPNVEEHTGVRIELVGDPDYDFTTPLDFSKDPYGSTKISFKVFAEDETVKPKIYKIEVEKQKNSANKITQFAFYSDQNDAIDKDVFATITNNYIEVVVPYNTNLKNLIPEISNTGKVSPANNIAQDFSSSVNYKVIADDGSERIYTVFVVERNITPKIKSFIFTKDLNPFLNSDAVGIISEKTSQTSEELSQIDVTLPAGSTIFTLRPYIISTADTIDPVVGNLLNFITPQIYTVSLDNGESKQYQVNVNVAAEDASRITYFAFEKEYNPSLRKNVEGSIDDIAKEIKLTVPLDSDPTILIPTIAYHGKEISPESGVRQNFLADQIYKVTSQNSIVNNYTVTVAQEKNNMKKITNFAFRKVDNAHCLEEDIVAIIDETAKTIKVNIPYGTDLSNLKPEIKFLAETIYPDVSERKNFDKPVIYKVEAQDKSYEEYTVLINNIIPNDNVVLESLEIVSDMTTGNIVSNFDANRLNYIVNNDGTTFNIKAIPKNYLNKITINGQEYTAGTILSLNRTNFDDVIEVKVSTKDNLISETYKIRFTDQLILKSIELKDQSTTENLLTNFDINTLSYNINADETKNYDVLVKFESGNTVIKVNTEDFDTGSVYSVNASPDNESITLLIYGVEYNITLVKNATVENQLNTNLVLTTGDAVNYNYGAYTKPKVAISNNKAITVWTEKYNNEYQLWANVIDTSTGTGVNKILISTDNIPQSNCILLVDGNNVSISWSFGQEIYTRFLNMQSMTFLGNKINITSLATRKYKCKYKNNKFFIAWNEDAFITYARVIDTTTTTLSVSDKLNFGGLPLLAIDIADNGLRGIVFTLRQLTGTEGVYYQLRGRYIDLDTLNFHGSNNFYIAHLDEHLFKDDSFKAISYNSSLLITWNSIIVTGEHAITGCFLDYDTMTNASTWINFRGANHSIYNTSYLLTKVNNQAIICWSIARDSEYKIYAGMVDLATMQETSGEILLSSNLLNHKSGINVTTFDNKVLVSWLQSNDTGQICQNIYGRFVDVTTGTALGVSDKLFSSISENKYYSNDIMIDQSGLVNVTRINSVDDLNYNVFYQYIPYIKLEQDYMN